MEKEIEQLSKFIGQVPVKIEKKDNKLNLSFTKKVLFIKKEVNFVIEPNESIERLNVKSLQGKNLKSVYYKEPYLNLVFKKEGGLDFTLSIKIKELNLVK